MNSIGQTPSNEDDIFSSESIRISHKFWTENVLTLNADARQTISVLFFANLFHKIPECRKLIQCDIGNRAQQLFGMVEWLIMQLNMNSVHHDLCIRLEALGTLHTKWGVSENHYLPMLTALHAAFENKFPRQYTLKVKFCIEHLFMNAAAIITGKDVVALFPKRAQTLQCVTDLDGCLAHAIGREYLERYLEQSFCTEYVLFLRFFDEFQHSENVQKKYKMTTEMYKTHFDIHCRAPIEFSGTQQLKNVQDLKELLSSTQKHDRTKFSLALRDHVMDIYTDIKQMIEEDGSWDRFCAAISGIQSIVRDNATE